MRMLPFFAWGMALPLFNHLVRPQQESGRDRQTERLGHLDVEHQLELYGGLDGQLTRGRALEETIGIGCRAVKAVARVIPVRQQPAGLAEVAKGIDRRKAVTSGQRGDLGAMRD